MLILTTDFLEIVIKERVMVDCRVIREIVFLLDFYHHILTRDYLVWHQCILCTTVLSTIYLPPPPPPPLMIQKSLQSFCTPLGFYYELQLAFYYSPLEVLVTSKFWKATCVCMFTSSHSLIYDKKKKNHVLHSKHRLASCTQALPSRSSFWWRGLTHSSLCWEVMELEL